MKSISDESIQTEEENFSKCNLSGIYGNMRLNLVENYLLSNPYKQKVDYQLPRAGEGGNKE